MLLLIGVALAQTRAASHGLATATGANDGILPPTPRIRRRIRFQRQLMLPQQTAHWHLPETLHPSKRCELPCRACTKDSYTTVLVRRRRSFVGRSPLHCDRSVFPCCLHRCSVLYLFHEPERTVLVFCFHRTLFRGSLSSASSSRVRARTDNAVVDDTRCSRQAMPVFSDDVVHPLTR